MAGSGESDLSGGIVTSCLFGPFVTISCVRHGLTCIHKSRSDAKMQARLLASWCGGLLGRPVLGLFEARTMRPASNCLLPHISGNKS